MGETRARGESPPPPPSGPGLRGIHVSTYRLARPSSGHAGAHRLDHFSSFAFCDVGVFLSCFLCSDLATYSPDRSAHATGRGEPGVSRGWAKRRGASTLRSCQLYRRPRQRRAGCWGIIVAWGGGGAYGFKDVLPAFSLAVRIFADLIKSRKVRLPVATA